MPPSNRRAVLKRQPFIPDKDTFGQWLSDSGWFCKSAELPWRQNESSTSCIPPGVYQVRWQWSPKHQCNNYRLVDVPARTEIEIHAANIPTKQLLGCIAPGETFAVFPKGMNMSHNPTNPLVLERDYPGVTASMAMLGLLEMDLRDKDGKQVDFILEIVNG